MPKGERGFQKGRPKTGGRQPGSPNRVTVTVKGEVLKVFNLLQTEEYEGKYGLIAFAKKYPKEFYQLAGRLIPTEITGGETPIKITVSLKQGKKETHLPDGSSS